jgi:hypothetical protein
MEMGGGNQAKTKCPAGVASLTLLAFSPQDRGTKDSGYQDLVRGHIYIYVYIYMYIYRQNMQWGAAWIFPPGLGDDGAWEKCYGALMGCGRGKNAMWRSLVFPPGLGGEGAGKKCNGAQLGFFQNGAAVIFPPGLGDEGTGETCNGALLAFSPRIVAQKL